MVDNRKVIWKCEACEWSAEGTSSGYTLGMTHKRQNGPEHRVVLVDQETGEILTNEEGNPIRSVRTAQRLGLVKKKEKIPTLEPKRSSGAVGRLKAQEVPLDTRLIFLYEWDKLAIPEYDSDFSQWIFDCVLGFHIQNKDRFQLEKLFEVVK